MNQDNKETKESNSNNERNLNSINNNSNPNLLNNSLEKNNSVNNIKKDKITIPSTEKNSKLTTCKYTPISKNNDVDLSIVDQWCEIRTKNQPTRRSYHCFWTIEDFIYISGGINLNIGKSAEFYKINLAQQTPSWVKFTPKGVDCIEPLAYSAYSTYDNSFYILCGQNNLLQQVNTIFKLTPAIDSQSLEKEKESILNNIIASQEQNSIQTNDNIEKLDVQDTPCLESHCSASYKEGILIFGGFGKGVYSNKLYFYDVSKKKVIIKDQGETNKSPIGRINPACVVHLDMFYMFGGQNNDGKFLNDMWVYSLSKSNWEEITIKNSPEHMNMQPSGRSGHTMNIYNNEFYIFGGRVSNVMEVNEIWKFDPLSKNFEQIQELLLEQYEMDSTGELDDKRSFKKGSTVNKSYKANASMKLSNETMNKRKKPQNVFVNEAFEESMYKSFPSLSLMKSSLIYGMDVENSQWKKMMFTLISKSNQNNYVSIMGNIPTPRDGHSSIIYKNFMVIFGGDRNKFPMNDLYTFIF